MKRMLIGGLVTLIGFSACSTSSTPIVSAEKKDVQNSKTYKIPAQSIDIEKYIPKGEKVSLVNCSIMDYDGDIKPNIMEIDIETKGENTESTISLIHKYEDGEIVKHPIMSIKDTYQINLETKEITTTLVEEYDFFTEKTDYNFSLFPILTKEQRVNELLKLEKQGKLHPDGTVDYKIETKPHTITIKPKTPLEKPEDKKPDIRRDNRRGIFI